MRLRTFAQLAIAPLALLTACAFAPEPARIPRIELHQRVSNMVELHLGEAFLGSGTAQPVGPDLFLTAFHVVRMDDWISVSNLVTVTVDGRLVVEIIRVGDLDAALLRVAEPHGLPVWPLDARAIVPGEELTLTGWGYGEHRFSRHFGCVSQNCSSGQIAPGDSGGALLDSDGDIVAIGVAVSTRRFADHHAYIVSAVDIRRAMLAAGISLR